MTGKLIAGIILPIAVAVASELPDPNNFASIGWVVVILFALVGGLNQMFEFIERLQRKRRGLPMRQGPATDPPSREEWETVNARRETQMHEMNDKIDKVAIDNATQTEAIKNIRSSTQRIEDRLNRFFEDRRHER